MDLINYNKHWEEDYFYNFNIKRVYFEELKNKLENKFIILIIGLRRVWKTTLIFQLIDDLIKKWVLKDSILYYSFDEKKEIKEVINDYLKISNKDINKDKIYFFFDEIQKVEDWQNKVKVYYDLYPNIKIIVSGSSSLFLKSSESLAWRIETIKINTLYFKEFLKFKNLEYFLEKPLLYWDKLLLEFEKYLYRQYYDIINFNLLDSKKYIKDLKNKIIKQDAKNYFKIKNIDVMLKIFDIIASNPWMQIDYKNISNYLWVDSRTIQTYFYYLEESFLINKVYNFSTNLLTSEKKQKKIYLNWTTFFTWNWEITWELFENYIQNIFDYKYFYRLTKKEVDFIWVNNEWKITAIEVKYKSKIKKEDTKWIDFFAKKFNVSKKIIISKNFKWNIWDIEVIPFWEIENKIIYS